MTDQNTATIEAVELELRRPEQTLAHRATPRLQAPDPTVPVSESAALMQVIARAASDPNVNIDKMERLLQMQERIMAQRARGAYAAALARMQPELPEVNRRGKIEVRAKDASGERNGKLLQSTPYALWEDVNEAIKPVLAKHGFALSFRTGRSPEGSITVTGILSHEEGHQEETTMVLPHDSTGSKNAVQAIGSSTSYGKRYTAAALLNLTSRGEDDDGEAAGASEPLNLEQIEQLQTMIDEVGADTPRFCRTLGVEALAALPSRRFDEAVALLAKKRAAEARKRQAS